MDSLIQNPNRASQIIDFTGILDPPLAPTDLDGLVEWKDKGYIFVEVKYQDKKMPAGQKLALERLVNDAEKCGKRAYAILVRHNVEDTNAPIMLNDQLVYKVYSQHHWFFPMKQYTAGEFIRNAINYFEGN